MPIKIVFSFKILISFSDGQLTLVIKLLDFITSDDEFFISTPIFLYSSSWIPRWDA